jgi:hypothetical protein
MLPSFRVHKDGRSDKVATGNHISRRYL